MLLILTSMLGSPMDSRTSLSTIYSDASAGRWSCWMNSGFHSVHGFTQGHTLSQEWLPGRHTMNSAPERCLVYLVRSASSQTDSELPMPDSPRYSNPSCSP